MTFAILIIAVWWLAWSNGANDNFKGVATLYGCNAVRFTTALSMATVATFAGSVLSLMLAGRLAVAFSGKGLVPAELAGTAPLLIAVAGSAALTILLATRLGMPTSTTHALTGSLVGVALVVSAEAASFNQLWLNFLQPLLVSPVLAIGGAVLLYIPLRWLRRRLGVVPESCVCVESEPVAHRGDANALSAVATAPSIAVGRDCGERKDAAVVGIGAKTVVDSVHTTSALAVCFARAVNDTPKIAALLLATGMHGAGWKLSLVAIAMALGGWLGARRVAETMSRRITDLNTGQGLTANLVTAGLVLGASGAGVPVSTTHVSCGAIFGIGLVNRKSRWKTVSAVGATWLTTFPLAGLLSAVIYLIARSL